MMTDEQVLAYFKTNELQYANFRELANALQWQFPHDLFDALPVQCFVYQTRLKKYMVASVGKRNTNKILESMACYVNQLNLVIINLPKLALFYYGEKEKDISFYDFLKSVIEHEYLHAYFSHTKVLEDANRIKAIRDVRRECNVVYANSPHYQSGIVFYEKVYKKRSDYHLILEEEFLIQFYTTQFERNVITAGTTHFDKLASIMQDVNPYFGVAKVPKHIGKKLERVVF